MAYTKPFYVLIVALAVGAMMWQGGGFADLFSGNSPGGNLDSGEQFSESASDNPVNTNFTGDARASDGSLVGFVISGTTDVFAMISFVAYLPAEVMELGLPYWAARPLGVLATTIISIGLIQFATGRVFN